MNASRVYTFFGTPNIHTYTHTYTHTYSFQSPCGHLSHSLLTVLVSLPFAGNSYPMPEASKVISNCFWLFFEECPGGRDCSHWASSKAGDIRQPCKWALPGTHQHIIILWERCFESSSPTTLLSGCQAVHVQVGWEWGIGQGKIPQSFMFLFPK